MDDLISRQGAIDALTEYGNGRAVYISVEEAVRRIEQLPSAQPRVIGYWVYDPDGMDWNIPAWRCSECHQRNDMIPTIIRHKGNVFNKVENPYTWAGSKFCPNCGAAMERGNTK